MALSTAEQVLLHLKEKEVQQRNPNPDDLRQLCEYVKSSSLRKSITGSLATSGTSKNDGTHPFCGLAEEATREVATYLLYLFSYNRSGMVDSWMTSLESAVATCDECARGFCIARRNFIAKYISKFPIEAQRNFGKAVDDWQVEQILKELHGGNTVINLEDDDDVKVVNVSHRSLLDLPSPHLQLLFGCANDSILGHAKIRAKDLQGGIVATVTRKDVSYAAPICSNLVKLGLLPSLVLLAAAGSEAMSATVDESDSKLRYWAKMQISACGRKPVKPLEWVGLGLAEAWEVALPIARPDVGAKKATDRDEEHDIERWQAALAIIESGSLHPRTLEEFVLGPGNRNLLALVASRIADRTPVFPILLKIFSICVRAHPRAMLWKNADPSVQFALTTVNQIQSNSDYLDLLVRAFDPNYENKTQDSSIAGFDRVLSDLRFVAASQLPSTRTGPKGKGRADHPSEWIVNWFPEYLMSIRDLDSYRLIHAPKDAPPSVDDLAFADAMATSMGFFMQTLQARRYSEDFRAAIVEYGIRTFSALCSAPPVTSASLARYIRKVFVNALDIHANTIVSAALGTVDHSIPAWSIARRTVQEFLKDVFVIDGNMVRSLYTHLGGQANEARRRKTKHPQDTFSTARVATELWSKTYELISSTRLDGIPPIMQGIRRFAHLPIPGGRAWSHENLEFWKAEQKWAHSVTTLRSTMKAMKDAFGTKVTSAVSVSDPGRLRDLWSTPEFPQLVMHLLLCSDEDVHNAVIGLIQTTYEDVDSRVDCIRQMLTTYPGDTIKGMIEFLDNWNNDVRDMPTAVETARWVVRCFTDIIDVLCRQTNVSTGFVFLSDEVFRATPIGSKKLSDYLFKLWNSMTSSLANIFKMTSRWAPFFDNKEMVDWMQDALIFGRLLVEETQNFETAVMGSIHVTPGSSQSRSLEKKTASKLVDDLEPVLENLLAWLRLTEVETLHQSFQLLKLLLTYCIRSRGNNDSTEAFKRSCFTIENFCRRVKRHKTLLDEGQLSELFDLITPFMERVQVLGDSEDEKPVTQPETVVAKSDKPPAIPGKNAFTHMMQKAGRTTSTQPSIGREAKTSIATKSTTASPRSSPAPAGAYNSEDEFDSITLDDMSVKELARAEREAASATLQRNLDRMHARPTAKSGSVPAKTSSSKSTVPIRTGGSSSVLGRLRQEAFTERKSKDVGLPRVTMTTVSRDREGRKPIHNAAANIRARAESESSDATDSEDDGGLGALQKLQKESAKPINRPKIQILRTERVAPRMTDAERHRLAAYRTKMRLKPDIGELFRTIMLWDPSDRGPIKNYTLNKIPSRFKTPQDYQRAFTALFFQELRDQSRSELDDESNNKNAVPINVEIINKQHSDDYNDLELNPVGNNMLDGWYVNDSDLCIMRRGELQVFATVRGFKRSSKNITINVRVHNSREKYGMEVKDRWIIVKHMNLSTAIREFSALQGMPYYEPGILDAILEARPRDLPEVTDTTAQKAMDRYQVNEPQARAIVGAMRVEGFALIQGPPGTGKTKTISGLAGRFMDNRPATISLRDAGDTRLAKLLICAPSNAAIDEVTRRLKDGVPSAGGKMVIPRIIRIGNESSMNPAVKDVSLDALVEARVSSVQRSNGKGDTSSDISRAEQALDKIKQDREALQKELQAVGDNEQKRQALANDMQVLMKQRIEKSRELDRARDAARDVTRQLDGARREAREAILREADIICGTLAGVGHESLQQYDFDTVIIDEAAQSVEISALIPLKYKCKRCILVGDPKQLPPTVISTTAQDFGYNRSLFVRMSNQHPSAMHLLSIQYRMHPDISRLPSKAFYDGRLRDGPGMAQKTVAPWHATSVFGTYRFFNVDSPESSGARRSVLNKGEVEAIINLYRSLRTLYGESDGLFGRVGIVTPYKAQQMELRRVLRNYFGDRVFDEIDIGTIDGFQGQEKDIIILSTVRSGTNQTSIGFVQDQRRMNVALTRAKSSLFIFGNGPTLARSDATWKSIVQDAKERNFYIPYTPQTFMNLTVDRSLLTRKPIENGAEACDESRTSHFSGAKKEPGELSPPAVTRPPTDKGYNSDRKRLRSPDMRNDEAGAESMRKKSKLKRIDNDGQAVRRDDDGVTSTSNAGPLKKDGNRTKRDKADKKEPDVDMDFFSGPSKSTTVKRKETAPVPAASRDVAVTNLSRKPADGSSSTSLSKAQNGVNGEKAVNASRPKVSARASGGDGLFIKKKKTNRPATAVPLLPPNDYQPPS